MTLDRTGLRLFWCFFALYALTSSGNAFRVPDEFEVYFQASHLADAGTIAVPQTLAITQEGQSIFVGEFGTDGQPYAPYGPGVAFLIEPFHLFGRVVARLAGVPRAPLPAGIAWEMLVGGLTTYASAFAAALAVAGFYRASRALGAPRRRGLLLALILGGATLLWPYATTLYSEAWLAAAFAWAAALLLEARVRDDHARARVMTAAALLALAIVAKPTAVVVAPGFVLAALLEPRLPVRMRWTVALGLAVTAAAMMAVHVGWNLQRFGRPLDFGYNLGAMIPQLPARSFALEDLPRGLFVQILTPGKSLFVWAPAALLGLFALPAMRVHERGLVAGVTVAIVAPLLFYSAFLFPEGGYAHGPRHLVPVIPLLLLPLCVEGVPWPGRKLAACAAIGFVMAALGASVSFLEDQSPPGSAARVLTGPYYERIDPAPGRPWHRYRIDYIPFKYALTSGHWWAANRPAGDGPDFFPLHLDRARASLPGGHAIPSWLPWAVTLPWLVLLAWSAPPLRRVLGEN